MFHHSIESLFGYHGARAASLWIHIVMQILNDLAKTLLGLLVKIADGNPRCQYGIIWVCRGLVCGRFGCQIIELNGRDPLVDTIDNLSCNFDGINKVHVQAIAKFSHAGGNLVEADFFLATVCNTVR